MPSTAAAGRRREQRGLLQRISSDKYGIIVFIGSFSKDILIALKKMHCSPQKVFYVTKFLFGKQNSAYL